MQVKLMRTRRGGVKSRVLFCKQNNFVTTSTTCKSLFPTCTKHIPVASISLKPLLQLILYSQAFPGEYPASRHSSLISVPLQHGKHLRVVQLSYRSDHTVPFSHNLVTEIFEKVQFCSATDQFVPGGQSGMISSGRNEQFFSSVNQTAPSSHWMQSVSVSLLHRMISCHPAGRKSFIHINSDQVRDARKGFCTLWYMGELVSSCVKIILSDGFIVWWY